MIYRVAGYDWGQIIGVGSKGHQLSAASLMDLRSRDACSDINVYHAFGLRPRRGGIVVDAMRTSKVLIIDADKQKDTSDESMTISRCGRQARGPCITVTSRHGPTSSAGNGLATAGLCTAQQCELGSKSGEM